MKPRVIITLGIAIIIFFGILKMRSNFEDYKKDKAQQEIDSFYSKLHSGQVNNGVAIQVDIATIMQYNELTDAQMQRLRTTKDSLSHEFMAKAEEARKRQQQ